jgi:hypothetical protein
MGSYSPPLPKTCGNWRSLSSSRRPYSLHEAARLNFASPATAAGAHIAIFKAPGFCTLSVDARPSGVRKCCIS